MSEPPVPREGPLGRLRAWMRRTPNGETAAAMIAVGGLLIVVAVLLVIFAL